MKINVNRKSLLAALNAVSGVVQTKSPRAILQNVKIVAGDLFTNGDDGPAIWATDMEVSIRYLIPNVQVIDPGSVVLPPGRLKDILAKATCDDLTIETDDDSDKIRIRGVKLKYDLPSENPDLFPNPENFDTEDYHVVAAGDLKTLIARTSFACDLGCSTKYAMGGVLMELSADTLTMASSDGRRLAEAKASIEVSGQPKTYVNGGGSKSAPDATQAPVIPLKTLALLNKILDNTSPAVHVAVQVDAAQSPASVTVRTDRATVYSRVIAGRFPRYEDVFPKGTGTVINLPVGLFREVVEQAAIATSEETRGVDFKFTNGLLRLNAQACDVGSAETEMDIEYTGAETKVTFDPDYLLDALRAIGDDQTVRADFRPKETSVFRVEGYAYGACPMTFDR